MLQDGEKELIRRYVRDLLSDAEKQFVADKIREDESWRDACAIDRKELEIESASQGAVHETHKQPRKFVPGKKMITIMIIGWVLLAIAVIIMVVDMANRGTERRKQKEKIKTQDTTINR